MDRQMKKNINPYGLFIYISNEEINPVTKESTKYTLFKKCTDKKQQQGKTKPEIY